MPDESAVFRLFTFPDIKSAALEIKPKGSPVQKTVMEKESDCIWSVTLRRGIIEHGDRYRFLIDYKDRLTPVKDPCSMYQDEYFKWSRIYNHDLFNWTDKEWMTGAAPGRISRQAEDTGRFAPVSSLRIYELHIGTLTDKGTFLSAKEVLPEIAEMNYNAVEIMPVENTYSFNWGYDGTDKYAPNHTYGTPDDLKELIDYAHSLKLNVIIDMVPNHLGPDIAELQNTGPYTDGMNCFGYKFNFENSPFSPYVRDFIIGAALNWVINYHADGIRADMTKFMDSDFTMKEMAAELNFHAPDAFLIAEDGRGNDNRVTSRFPQAEYMENQIHHGQFIEKIKKNNVSLYTLGFDTEWDFPFHKQIASSVLGEWDCRLKNLKDFDYSLRDAQTRVKYIMSHDEIGNIDGTRLISKILAQELHLADAVCTCSPDLKCKTAAHAAHRLAVSFISGEYEKMNASERRKFCGKLDLSVCFAPEDIFEAYKRAVRKHKLALGKVYSIPGPKMVFQGDERADLSYFKFFRKFSDGPEPGLKEKGYEPGMSAFLDSKLNSVKVSDKYSYINEAVKRYVSDLNFLCSQNIALSSGHIEKTIADFNSDVHAVHTKKIYNEIFSVSNFSNASYSKNYGIMFPKGRWREAVNSNGTKYAGSGEYLNENSIQEQFSYISLGAYSIAFFAKIS